MRSRSPLRVLKLRRMNNSKPVVGVVIDNPLAGADVGFQLKLHAFPQPALKLQDTPDDWTYFDGILIKTMFESGGQQRVHGSGVMVGPGVALAARHVVEPEIEDVLAGRTRMGALALTPHGLAIWEVHQIRFWDQSDIVIMTMRLKTSLPPNNTLRHALLTTRLTPVGEAVAAIGFIAESESFDVGAGIKGRIHIAQGLVIEHVLGGRPGLPGPSMWVGVGAPGGMSGGPVFDEAGALIGVLSKAIGDDADGVFAVSLLPQALIEPFTPCWPDGLQVGETCLRDLSNTINSIEKPEAVEVGFDLQGRRQAIWRHWR